MCTSDTVGAGGSVRTTGSVSAGYAVGAGSWVGAVGTSTRGRIASASSSRTSIGIADSSGCIPVTVYAGVGSISDAAAMGAVLTLTATAILIASGVAEGPTTSV